MVINPSIIMLQPSRVTCTLPSVACSLRMILPWNLYSLNVTSHLILYNLCVSRTYMLGFYGWFVFSIPRTESCLSRSNAGVVHRRSPKTSILSPHGSYVYVSVECNDIILLVHPVCWAVVLFATYYFQPQRDRVKIHRVQAKTYT